MVKRIPPFRCSKVLPLVYDESLSYYEAICKITEKINDLIDYVQTYVLPSVDTEMSDTSEHPVQNKVIKEYVDSQSGAIIDTEMSDTSENAVQNKVIKEYVDNSIPSISVDTEMSSTSENAVQNKVIKEYVDNSIPTITVDTTMSDTSTNAVQNKVIKQYVDSKIMSLRVIKATDTNQYSLIPSGRQTITNFITLPAGLYAVNLGMRIQLSGSVETDYDYHVYLENSSGNIILERNGLNANTTRSLQYLNIMEDTTYNLEYVNGSSATATLGLGYVKAIRLGDYVIEESGE